MYVPEKTEFRRERSAVVPALVAVLLAAIVLGVACFVTLTTAHADEEKVATPTVEKLIGERDGDSRVTFAKRADAQIGASIPYQVVGTLPESYDSAKTYSYTFIDQHPTNLVIDENSIVVSLEDKAGYLGEITEGFEVRNTSGCLEVHFENLKAALNATSADKIVLYYEAKLTEDSGFGVGGATQNSVVVGKRNGSAHAWNKVKISGKWYYVDVCHDDPIVNGKDTTKGQSKYWLCSSSTFKKYGYRW